MKVLLVVWSLVPNSLQPMDWSPPDSVYGISQAWILEWVAISLPKGSSPPKDPTCVSYMGRQIFFFFFNHWAEREIPWRHSQRKKTNLVDSFPCIECFRGQMCVFAGFFRLYESERELSAMVCSINILRLLSPRRSAYALPYFFAVSGSNITSRWKRVRQIFPVSR